MKKVLLYLFILLSFVLMNGCKKEEIFLSVDDITANTFLLKRDGSLYVAIIEDFDKNYYNLSELNEFVAKEVNAYNEKAGGKEINIEKLELKNGRVVMILGYSKMAHYSAFNNMPAAYFGADTKDVALELPSQYLDAKKNEVVDKDTALKNGKNKVLVLYEPYEIIVEGDIKYYSENATLVDKNRIRSADENMTVVIYRP
ncbi:hypothetical protein DFR55_11118 [Herbinix hemicellulosilytica]|uniref:Uncharacterized protein n=1 Tax=Herbinix hemicellulosilytica TaxID=1564487 RepID=A0A0H5SHW1_HERHM|nr:hypothetical protein [Herbinix hemicellulosilytica]RBP58481.1 hypothetical protein DFR55_11118 [Herbinix hemicellulosilytica]CRZ35054.1 hypothetical protein HHT355_1854 [Herbinix hemicellulosilytica]